ncbi:MAG: DUF4340 domain-containing protein [Butyrivibrio sp.]|nr:DUF4340 domain-containing protein [Butyrivibrio sp.]
MKKQKIQLIVVLVLMLVFICGYFGLKKYNSVIEAKEAEAEYQVLTLNEENISEIKSDNESGTFHLIKSDDTWTFAEDTENNVDQDSVSTLLENVLSVESDQAIFDVEDMSIYGLDEPVETITLVTSDGTYTIKIGDFNNTNSLYYMQLGDDATVYTVTSTIYTAFKKTDEDFIAEEEEEAATEASSEDVTVSEASDSSSTEETTADESTEETSVDASTEASE